MTLVDSGLLTLLACPIDHTHVEPEGQAVICRHGHVYPVFEGMPVMLLDSAQPTHPVFQTSLDIAAGQHDAHAAQKPTGSSIDSYYHRIKFRNSDNVFRVRYWSPSELREVFEETIGETTVGTDCYLGLGIQASDLHLLPPQHQIFVRLSEFLRRTGDYLPQLKYVADSLDVKSVPVSNDDNKSEGIGKRSKFS